MPENKKSVPKKKSYTLKKVVSVNGKDLQPGDKIELTDKGRDSFKFKHRI